jgi:hypothetical protein
MSSGNLQGNAIIRDALRDRIFKEITASGRASEPNWRRIHQWDRTINRLQKWDNIMTRKTYRIELKIDFADDTRHELVEQLVRQYGRDLLSSTMLLQDGRKPLVALVVDDSFVGTEEIELMDESDNIHKPDGEV